MYHAFGNSSGHVTIPTTCISIIRGEQFSFSPPAFAVATARSQLQFASKRSEGEKAGMRADNQPSILTWKIMIRV